MKSKFDIANEINPNDENLDEPETQTAEWRTDVAGNTDFSERSNCGA